MPTYYGAMYTGAQGHDGGAGEGHATPPRSLTRSEEPSSGRRSLGMGSGRGSGSGKGFESSHQPEHYGIASEV